MEGVTDYTEEKEMSIPGAGARAPASSLLKRLESAQGGSGGAQSTTIMDGLLAAAGPPQSYWPKPGEMAEELQVATTAQEHVVRSQWRRALAIYDALSDAVMALITIAAALVGWIALELGPAVAVTYLNWEKLYEIFTTKALGSLSWGEIASATAFIVLVLSAWRRLAKEHKDKADWKKVREYFF